MASNLAKVVAFVLLSCLHFSHGTDPQPEQIHLSSTGEEGNDKKSGVCTGIERFSLSPLYNSISTVNAQILTGIKLTVGRWDPSIRVLHKFESYVLH